MGTRRYEITVAGHVSEAVAAQFAPLHVVRVDGHTVISGDDLDQAAVHGALRRIESFALELLAIETAGNPADLE